MIVVSDTSPITSLLSVEKSDLLQKLFETVIIPPAVEKELHQYHIDLPEFIKVRVLEDLDSVKMLANKLDQGEAEAIVLAKELKADFLLIDEALGRSLALQNRIRVIGLLGVLVLAKRKALISSLKDVIDELEQKAGFYISRTLKVRVLGEVGED